jgi:hypothetical protein
VYCSDFLFLVLFFFSVVSVVVCLLVLFRFVGKNRKFHGSNLCFLNSSLIASFTASETLT